MFVTLHGTWSGQPAVGPNVLRGDPTGLVARQEQHEVGDVFRLADPSERGHRRHALDVRFALAFGEQLRVGRPGRDDVDRDAALIPTSLAKMRVNCSTAALVAQ
jgi:hypothetical protein